MPSATAAGIRAAAVLVPVIVPVSGSARARSRGGRRVRRV